MNNAEKIAVPLTTVRTMSATVAADQSMSPLVSATVSTTSATLRRPIRRSDKSLVMSWASSGSGRT